MIEKPPVKLQKLLARAGVGSRRYCDGLIREGRVTVDGLRITELGTRAFPDSYVEVDGAPVRLLDYGDPETRFIYILLYKPAGIISSARDQFGRKTVVDLVGSEAAGRVYPVGRLDYQTAGLILLTDDGDFTYRATHPKFGVEKVYDALCDKPPVASAIENLRGGVALEDGFRASPARVRIDATDPRKLTIVLREGKNRQVRRMIEAIGYSVIALTRTAIGGLDLGGLAPGEWRKLGGDEAKRVFEPYRSV